MATAYPQAIINLKKLIMRKIINHIKNKLRERRIKRFKARLAEAYPDAVKFIEKVAWLDGTDEFMVDGILNVPDVKLWFTPAQEDVAD